MMNLKMMNKNPQFFTVASSSVRVSRVAASPSPTADCNLKIMIMMIKIIVTMMVTMTIKIIIDIIMMVSFRLG